ncbi:hypothetical protein ACFLXV_00150 [Chloroflexota bacterium]
MRAIGLVVSIIGAIITAVGAQFFFGDFGISTSDLIRGTASVLFGLAVGAIGAIIYLTDFLLRIFKNRESILIDLYLRILGLEFRGELKAPVEDDMDAEYEVNGREFAQ